MGEFPSGQRGQTVNLLSVTSVVRIHSLPPKESTLKGAFLFAVFGQIQFVRRSAGVWNRKSVGYRKAQRFFSKYKSSPHNNRTVQILSYRKQSVKKNPWLMQYKPRIYYFIKALYCKISVFAAGCNKEIFYTDEYPTKSAGRFSVYFKYSPIRK